jgi:hypothetical protein
MDRRQLESAGANYPYTHVQGLYGLHFGFAMFLVGLSNLEDPPGGPWVLGGLVLLILAALAGVPLYYQRTFGRVTPTRSRRLRYLTAAAAGFAVFVAADQLGRTILGRPPQEPVSTTAAGWALGMLVFYAVGAGLRAHHMVIWGAVLAAGVLPIWGLGSERDAIAYFPIGAATIAAGLLDHRLLVRTFQTYQDLNLEDSNAGA